MQAPGHFWHPPGLTARLLLPFSWVYRFGAWLRGLFTRPQKVGVPVVCIGNLVAGGAGKTPVVLSLLERLSQHDLEVHCLLRGYGGALEGPVLVDLEKHSVAEVGDEALLLARKAPTWVAKTKAAGARAAAQAGAELILMDDGYQNPSLHKDAHILVVDARFGFGNGHCIPAGPLREPIKSGLSRADVIVLLGHPETELLRTLATAPVLLAGEHLVKANLQPTAAEEVAGQRLLAFAGIGQPSKFFRSLEEAGAELVACQPFADHHPYSQRDLEGLAARAEKASARLITTDKDWVRLSPEWRGRVAHFPVAIVWDHPEEIEQLLEPFLP